MKCSHPFFRIPLYPWEKAPRDFKVKNGSILLSCNKVDYEYITNVFPSNILDRLQLIPCGKCMACRINKAEEWSTRCALELLDHEHACFLTLTYDDSFLSYGYRINHRHQTISLEPTLVKKDFQDFNKRLRKYYDSLGIKLRFFACGEYGSCTSRPHYHSIYFGMPMPLDLVKFRRSRLSDDSQINLYTSNTIEDLWGKGFISIGQVEWNSINYVCRYTTKKFRSSYLSEDERLFHDCMVDYIHDELESKVLEDDFLLMSRRPGLARSYFENNSSKIYEFDKLVVPRLGSRPKVLRPPRYYDKLFDLEDPGAFKKIHFKRLATSERVAKLAKTNGLSFMENLELNDRLAKELQSKRPRSQL